MSEWKVDLLGPILPRVPKRTPAPTSVEWRYTFSERQQIAYDEGRAGVMAVIGRYSSIDEVYAWAYGNERHRLRD